MEIAVNVTAVASATVPAMETIWVLKISMDRITVAAMDLVSATAPAPRETGAAEQLLDAIWG